MSKYSVEQLADIGNRESIREEIKEILAREKLLETGNLDELFGLSSRASQFIVKAIVLSAIHRCPHALSSKLLQHMESHSWCSFNYSIVSGELPIEDAADVAYDMAFTMAGVLQGKF
jgi:hypothetical protein